jgi:hypothetical protein
MRATIVARDNTMLVDGFACRIDCSALVAEGKHAVQWSNTIGSVEFLTNVNAETGAISRKPNEVIHDFSEYQSYYDAWLVEKERLEAEAVVNKKRSEEAVVANQQREKEEKQRFKEEIIAEVMARLKDKA